MLNFLEQTNAYNAMNFTRVNSSRMRDGGNNIVSPNFTSHIMTQSTFLCPSDANTGDQGGENNYRANFGGSTPYAGGGARGDTNANLPRAGTDNGAFTFGKGVYGKLRGKVLGTSVRVIQSNAR